MATTKIINIEGEDVLFRASAALPLVYRRLFQADIYQDLQNLLSSLQNQEAESLDLSALQIISNIAYAMAVHANKSIGDMEVWLEKFDMFSLQSAALELIDLWRMDNITLVQAKKNVVAPKEV